MLTVCIDANVYISAIAFGGKPSKIIELALARKVYLEISSIYQPTGTVKFIQHKADNLVLETAIMANADVLVTGDKKIYSHLKKYMVLLSSRHLLFLIDSKKWVFYNKCATA